jgi:hypothetical protein
MAYAHEVSIAAAKAWAQGNASGALDPVRFGHEVALVFLASEKTQENQGDERATTAALAALSIPPETLRALAQLCASFPPRPAGSWKTNSDGSGE